MAVKIETAGLREEIAVLTGQITQLAEVRVHTGDIPVTPPTPLPLSPSSPPSLPLYHRTMPRR